MGTTNTDLDPTIFGTTDSENWLWSYRLGWVPVIRGGSEDDPDGDGDPGTDDDPDGTSADDDDPKDDKPGKTFTQDEVTAIAAREKAKALRGKVDPKELGFGSAKEMQTFIDEQKAKSESDKTEDEKAREEAIAAAKQEATDSVLTKANERVLKAEFLIAAADAGVPKEARGDALLLAKNLEIWEGVEIDDDGNVTGFDEAFFEELKEKKPFLFGSSSDEDEDDDIGGGARSGSKQGNAKEQALIAEYPALSHLAKR